MLPRYGISINRLKRRAPWKHNVPEAQYALGCMYEKGEVAKQNMKEAIRWYEAAAKSGNHDAEAALERLKPKWKKYFRILGK